MKLYFWISVRRMKEERQWRMLPSVWRKKYSYLLRSAAAFRASKTLLLLRCGADKVSLNSAAVKDPQLIAQGAEIFGSQCIVVAIDARKREDGSGWNVFVNGGRKDTGIDLIEWVKKVVSLGAGEILLTSMDADGTRNGFDLPMLKAVNECIDVPLIASGGCGTIEHIEEVFQQDGADAALAASIFHYGDHSVREVKEYLAEKGIPMRLEVTK